MTRVHGPKRRLSSHLASIFALACCCLFFVLKNSSKLTLGLTTYYTNELSLLPQRSNPDFDPTKFQKAVHLVHTRFMQGQPNMLALGASRIELFKTFCLPTMANQTTNDFLWIILMDPDLHDDLLEEMKQLVAPYPHFFLVKLVAQEIDLQNLEMDLIVSGDPNLLVQAAHMVKYKILMQTRLDADDGLAFGLLEQMQTTAVATLQPEGSNRPRGWMIACVKKHFEWHYELHGNNTEDLTGWLRQSVTPSFCITPGLTLSEAPGGRTWHEMDRLPIYPHDRITRRFARCGGNHTIRTECFHTLNEISDPAAVRSRTPASSFMRGVGTTEKRSKTPQHHWQMLEDSFGLTKEILTQTRNYLTGNMKDIALENLGTQCTGMNPCHEKDLARLAALADINITDLDRYVALRPEDDTKKFDKAVHLVYTRFMQGQPSLLALGASRLELFKTFCLPTMISQSTSNFLWIILVDPNLHPSLMEELKQLVEPYPHFIVIRKMTFEIVLQDLNLSLVESGDKNLLVRAARELHSKVLVETRLDADDGLANTLIERMQTQAVEALQGYNTSANEPAWMVQCIRHHLEWHYDMRTNETADIYGWLKMENIPGLCVTPGLTLAQAPGSKHTTFTAVGAHDKITKRYSRCNKSNRTICFRMADEFNATEPASIRSRTPASSFMVGVGDTDKREDTPEEYWNMLERMFKIQRKDLAETRNYLMGNVQAIAKENLDSQCRGMHGCRNVTKEKLAELASDGRI